VVPVPSPAFRTSTDADEGVGTTFETKRSFGVPGGLVYNAVSGTGVLVRDGHACPTGHGEIGAKTAVGADRAGRVLYLVVVDGKQPHYSEGLYMQELADLLPATIPGIYAAIVVDGGGSSTMAAQLPGGGTELLNSPINMYVVGWERAVANHLAVYAPPAP